MRDGDRVTIDADGKAVSVALTEVELRARRSAWEPPPAKAIAGVLAKYARTVRSASEGAVTC